MFEKKLELDSILRPERNSEKIREDLFSFSLERTIKNHKFFWRDFAASENRLPSIAMPTDGDVADFFADIASFYADYSPITAFMYVLPHAMPELEELCKRGGFKKEDMRSTRRRFSHLWIALAIAESVSAAFENSDADAGLNYSICRRSLSFSIARTAILYPEISSKSVVHRWEKLRQIVKMPISDTVPDTLLSIATLIRDDEVSPDEFMSCGDNFVHTLAGLVFSRVSFKEMNEVLDNAYPGLSNEIYIFSKSFDERIGAFERGVARIKGASQSAFMDSIAIGYLANLIQPGSFSHLKLISKFSGYYPGVIIWYGFFSSLSDGFDANSLYHGLGRKLLRDIEADFDPFANPACDISLDELEALSRVNLSNSFLKPMQQRAVSVSLLPGVDIIVRVPNDDAGARKESVERTRSKTPDRDAQLRDLVKLMTELLSEDKLNLSAVEVEKKVTPASKKKKTSIRKNTGKPNDL